MVKVRLHSAGDASPLTALLLLQIFPIFSVVAPCQRGASPPLGATSDFHHGLLTLTLCCRRSAERCADPRARAAGASLWAVSISVLLGMRGNPTIEGGRRTRRKEQPPGASFPSN